MNERVSLVKWVECRKKKGVGVDLGDEDEKYEREREAGV